MLSLIILCYIVTVYDFPPHLWFSWVSWAKEQVRVEVLEVLYERLEELLEKSRQLKKNSISSELWDRV